MRRMPRFPQFSERTSLVSGSVFEKFRSKMAARGSDMVTLHIGDAYLPPPYPLPIDPAFTADRPGFNRYCDTFGIPELRAALSEKLQSDNALPAGPEHILVTAGATNALSATFFSIVDPGDEVVFLSPYWPFARGMVRLAGGSVVEVPLYTRAGDDADVAAMVEPHITERSAAIYLNTPNNPSGVVLTRAHIEAVAEIARRNNLWLVSDEAYDGMTYDGREHVSAGSLDGMFERTVSVFTFSKVFMFAGIRIGYAASGADAIRTINKVMVHMLYSPSTIAQQMLVEPVRSRADWYGKFVEECRVMRDHVGERLTADVPVPGGAYYYFFDASPWLRGRTPAQLIDACLDAGVTVAPGEDFGADYATWIRLCFAGVPPEQALAGVDRLNEVLVGGV